MCSKEEEKEKCQTPTWAQVIIRTRQQKENCKIDIGKIKKNGGNLLKLDNG